MLAILLGYNGQIAGATAAKLHSLALAVSGILRAWRKVRHLARIGLKLNGAALFGATGAKQSAKTSVPEWR